MKLTNLAVFGVLLTGQVNALTAVYTPPVFNSPSTRGYVIPALALNAFPGQVVRVVSEAPVKLGELNALLDRALNTTPGSAYIVRQGSQFLISGENTDRAVYLDLSRPRQVRTLVLDINKLDVNGPSVSTVSERAPSALRPLWPTEALSATWQPSSAAQIEQVAASSTPETAIPRGLVLRFLPGGSVLIVSPEGSTAVYSTGTSLSATPRSLLPARLGLLVAGRADEAEQDGLSTFITANAPQVVIAPAGSLPRTRSLDQSGATVQAAGNQVVQLGSVILTVLAPSADEPDGSVGLIVDYGDFRAVLSAGASTKQTAAWREQFGSEALDNANANVCVTPKFGADPDWLGALSPGMLIASKAGTDGGLNADANAGSQTYLTSARGMISVYAQSDGAALSISQR